MESDGAQRPSNLPSRKTYRDDYNALIFNGKKNPSVPLDMGRYGDYAPHTVEYQIYIEEKRPIAAAWPRAAAAAVLLYA